MDLLALLRLTIRRWVVVVPVLILTFAVLVMLVTNRRTDYAVAGSYLLVGGQGASRVEPIVAVDVLDDLLLQQSVRDELGSRGLSTTYGATIGQTGTSLRLRVTGDDPSVVVETANQLVLMAPQLLQSLFGDSAATIRTQPVSAPTVDDVIQNGETFAVETSIVVASVLAADGNPFQATLATVVSLVRATSSVEFAPRIEEFAPGLTFEITGTVREAPIVDVSVNAPSSAAALEGFGFLRSQIEAELTRLQGGVDSKDRTVMWAIVEPTAADPTPSSLVRPVAGVVLLGGALAVGLAVLVESAVLALRRGDIVAGSRLAWLRRLVGSPAGAAKRGSVEADGGQETAAAVADDRQEGADTADTTDTADSQSVAIADWRQRPGRAGRRPAREVR